jgi:hypothetical protein
MESTSSRSKSSMARDDRATLSKRSARAPVWTKAPIPFSSAAMAPVIAPMFDFWSDVNAT